MKKNKENKNKNCQHLRCEEITQIFSNAGKPLNYKQVAARLNLHDNSQKMKLNFLLKDMAKKKILTETKYEKYLLNEQGTDKKKKVFSHKSSELIIGKVDMITSGAAYIIIEGREDDVYVSSHKMMSAIDGDTVCIRLLHRRKGKKQEGEIVKIVHRSKTEFVGIIQLSNKFAFLVPDNSKIPFDIHIPFDKILGAKNGQKVIAKVVHWYNERKNPDGEIIKVLGDPGKNETEIHAILAEYGLPYDFPKEVEKAAEKISAEITKEEILSRRDFRSVTTFTIDPVDANDFDDAVSIRKLSNGNWEIGVHIADVTHYVKENSVLDKEAYARATSIYLVDRVVPMLPENLSNVICSLRPEEEKLCFSAVFNMDDDANVLQQWFGKTVIRSHKRFTYEQAQEIIESGKGYLSTEMLVLDRLSKKLREKRFKRGSIAFDKLEIKFHLDELGNPTSVYFKEMKDSNKLIEDFMLLANRAVAEFCSLPHSSSLSHIEKEAKCHEIERKSLFIYRVHDKPDGEKLKAFAEIAKKFGYKMNLKNEITIAESMNKILAEVVGKPEANMIEMLAIRTMSKAIYTTNNIGHYGLGFKHYTHFTSPIRRYPDMMVHRLLERKLASNIAYIHPTKKKRDFFSPPSNELENACKHSSQQEKLAAEAERASVKYKQVQYLMNRVDEEFEAVISGVSEWGIFVEIIDSHCEGLVKIKDLTNDYYFLDDKNKRLIGRKTKHCLTLGDKIKVILKRADMKKKQLDFSLVE
ncbi:MAG: ribonuclease R [Bacteroidota bacterium]